MKAVSVAWWIAGARFFLLFHFGRRPINNEGTWHANGLFDIPVHVHAHTLAGCRKKEKKVTRQYEEIKPTLQLCSPDEALDYRPRGPLTCSLAAEIASNRTIILNMFMFTRCKDSAIKIAAGKHVPENVRQARAGSRKLQRTAHRTSSTAKAMSAVNMQAANGNSAGRTIQQLENATLIAVI